MGMPRNATKPQLAKIQNVVVDDRINYALTIQDKYIKRLKTYSTDRSRVTPCIDIRPCPCIIIISFVKIRYSNRVFKYLYHNY